MGLPISDLPHEMVREELTPVELEDYQTKVERVRAVPEYGIEQLATGRNHTVIVVVHYKSNERKILAFGHE